MIVKVEIIDKIKYLPQEVVMLEMVAKLYAIILLIMEWKDVHSTDE